MCLNGIDDVLGVAPILKNGATHAGMVFGVRILFIVKIMKKASYPPLFFILTKFAGIGLHCCCHGQGMFDQTFTLGVFVQQFLRIFACHSHPSKTPEKISLIGALW